MKRKKPVKMPGLANAEPMPPCPKCGSTNTAHSGWLYRYMPEDAEIEPPAQIARCRERSCWTAFRVDGQVFDETARIAAWKRAAAHGA